jgi:hypothetical protein
MSPDQKVLPLVPVADSIDFEEAALLYHGNDLLLLSSTASEIWRELDGLRTLGDVARRVSGRYPEEDAHVADEVAEFLAQLLRSGVVRTAEAAHGVPVKVTAACAFAEDEGDALLLLNLLTGRRLTLTGPGPRIWQAVVARQPLRALICDLQRDFPDDAARIEADVADLLERLTEEGLLARVAMTDR